MTILLLLHQLAPLLEGEGVENPLREIRILMARVLKRTYEDIFFGDDIILTAEQIAQIKEHVILRQQGIPLAKIIGEKEFWGLPFVVTMDTLDPRPESETLIEAVLQLYPDSNKPLSILDLGTGTGCLLLSVLHEFPQAKGIGVDLSQRALEIAKKNAVALGLSQRCFFLQSHWFDKVSGYFDLILANPPYIPPETPLSKETLYDPASALFAPENGLLHYRLILEQTSGFLNPLGYLIFEIGAGQHFDVIDLALQNGYRLVIARKDLLGYTRCLVFQRQD